MSAAPEVPETEVEETGSQNAAKKSHPSVRIHSEHTHDGVLSLLKALLEVVVVATFVITFLLQPFRIPSESMVPTLLVGDFLLVDKQSFGPGGVLDHVLPPEEVRRGDLVVFHYPVDPQIHVVKRVVGLPGDRLRMREGQVFVNEQALREPYAFRSRSQPDSFRDDFPSMRFADPSADPRWWAELRRIIRDGDITVPAGHYFVMGDNRNNSEDSRYWGFVPRDAIVGKPLVVYFTLSSPEGTTSTGSRWRDILRQIRVLR